MLMLTLLRVRIPACHSKREDPRLARNVGVNLPSASGREKASVAVPVGGQRAARTHPQVERRCLASTRETGPTAYHQPLEPGTLAGIPPLRGDGSSKGA